MIHGPATARRRARELRRHRQEIMEAALELFSEKGYHHCSMQEIAHRSGFGLGTIYRLFGNKEGLYRAMVEAKAREAHTALKRALLAPGGPVEVLAEYLRAKYGFVQGNSAFARLYLSLAQGSRFSVRAGMEPLVRRLHDEVLEQLSRLMAKGQEEGLLLPHFHSSTLAVALEGLSNGLLVRWLEDPGAELPSPEALLGLFLGPVAPEGVVEALMAEGGGA